MFLHRTEGEGVGGREGGREEGKGGGEQTGEVGGLPTPSHPSSKSGETLN